ncbi:MAG: CHRD domain-containing protein [Myxococcus sp.]|nr:CHRD domain-containing protein [Myxococcus sp.]
MLRFASCCALLVFSACGPNQKRVVMGAENNSGQSGFAVLTALSGGRTRVEVDLLPSNDPRAQPAHIHEGRCGEIGGIKAGLTDLAPTPAKGGHFFSTTEVAVSLEALLVGPFAINVHDARDFSLYISCGQLD